MKKKEIWKQVDGFPLYQVSNFGKVKSIKRVLFVESYHGRKPYKTERKEKLISVDIDDWGYLKVWLYFGKLKKGVLIHRLVASAFIDNPDNKKEVNHKNGNKKDNSVTNLEWVTPKENRTHATLTGLWKPMKSEDHPRANFTNNQVKKIRNLYSSGVKIRKLEKMFGVRYNIIWSVVKHKTYKDI